VPIRVQKNFMIETLKQLVTMALGLAAGDASLTLRPPLTYQSNHLYDLSADGKHWIVKEFTKPEEFDLAPRREYGALKLLEHLDIAPTPTYLQAEPRPSLGPFVVYEYMPGLMWDRRRPAAQALSQLADVWLAFDGLPVNDLPLARAYECSPDQVAAGWQRHFERYAAWAEAHFPEAMPAAQLCQQALAKHSDTIQALADARPRLAFGRSDSRFANIIARPGARLGLVDWEDSGLTDPALDIADLIVHANQEDLLSAGEWESFLVPYLAIRRLADPGLEHRLELHQAILSLMWLSILVALGLDKAGDGRFDGWLVNEMPANQRLRRYLARVLAWPKADFTGQLEALSELQFFPE
jgi:aminoglycoside phosphotransferase (APT) family kinase protein